MDDLILAFVGTILIAGLVWAMWAVKLLGQWIGLIPKPKERSSWARRDR